MDNDSQRLREANKAAFQKLLGHLGRKEFDAFQACLAEDMVQEWPYRPLPSLPERMVGAAEVRKLIETGMSDFDPYDYRIHAVHDLIDPQTIIAEYSSHSFYRRRQVPYENRYISILRFRDGKLVHWSEYVNPLVVKEALLDDFDKTPEQRTARATEAPAMEAPFRLMAADEIRDLKARYFRCLDSKDWPGFRSVFVDNAEFDMRDGRGTNLDPDAVVRGAEAITEFVRAGVGSLRTRHRGHVTQIDILSPAAARATWAMEDELEAQEGVTHPFRRLHGSGHYHETYARVGGRWLIRTLKLTRLWVRIDR